MAGDTSPASVGIELRAPRRARRRRQPRGRRCSRRSTSSPATCGRSSWALMPTTGGFAGPDAVHAAGEDRVAECSTRRHSGWAHNYIGCEHLLLGLLADPRGEPGQPGDAAHGPELRTTAGWWSSAHSPPCTGRRDLRARPSTESTLEQILAPPRHHRAPPRALTTLRRGVNGGRSGSRSWQSAPCLTNYFDERIAAIYDDRTEAEHVRAGRGRAGGELPRRSGRRAAARSSSASARAASHCRSASAAFRVHGIDVSRRDGRAAAGEAGRDDIGVTIGDFATTTGGRDASRSPTSSFNTIMNLTTQDEQVACFRNVAAHLEPGGCFVIEVIVPGAPAAPARRDGRRAFTVHPDASRLRRVRHRHAGPRLPPLLGRRRPARALLGAVPLRVAVRARPDGATRRA